MPITPSGKKFALNKVYELNNMYALKNRFLIKYYEQAARLSDFVCCIYACVYACICILAICLSIKFYVFYSL